MYNGLNSEMYVKFFPAQLQRRTGG